jgi:hypothetical protein
MNPTAGSNPASAAGKGCLTVFLGLFAIIGLIFTALIGKSSFDTLRTHFWDKTDCTILESSIREKGDSFEFDVRYSYRANGRMLTGTRFRAGMQTSLNPEEAERARHRYAAGNNATCHVNASVPSESVLEQGSLWLLLFAPLPLLFTIIGVGGIIGVWRAPRTAGEKAMSEKLRPRGAATIGLRIFGLIFALAGGGMLHTMLIRPMLKETSAANWPTVECEIVSSELRSHAGSEGGSNYSIDIRYRYAFGGQKYTGTRYNFESGSSSSRKWRAAVVADLPPGKKTVCHVNPADPFEAVLSIRASPDRWFGLLPGLFLVVGLLVFFKAPAMTGGRGKRGPGVGSPVPAALPGGAGGSVELKPAVAPLTGFLVMLVIALFWNGIVWAILLNMGKGDGVGRIFLSIFALIGAGLIAVVTYQFLALFNPRPILTANSTSVPLGGVLDVQWRFTGNVRRLTKLTIALQAREEATYRRGTTTTTDRNIFANITLAETADRAQIASGTAKITIPRELMHTFTARNNKIIWTLHVAGDIPRWPDVGAEFIIDVLPAGLHALPVEERSES